ncbi:molybdopterin synthase subunit MoaD [Andreprevotia lacus DSM 23236]|jgi:molybdopterin synthase sulfur carrier subunit|uniref:Molybdopterin synthase sulfur carrier subunit n=1 Tax=Andreprevotia lacus DSM 23236 TaxID=1121001 RepID=A0A1W1XG65_9NEIS|nr:MoaD/ThiS family protein [Andreprevotia lacus]SMC22986.1 molybdopterin synthase subunit MoaD [Andreprevotia lacus DSM 23236]
MSTLHLRYFARLRERFGRDAEPLGIPAVPYTVADVIALLVARGGIWADELGGPRVFRVAVDQEMAQLDTPVHDGAEVAIFPPVTGG